jgi:hypothetical protein
MDNIQRSNGNENHSSLSISLTLLLSRRTKFDASFYTWTDLIALYCKYVVGGLQQANMIYIGVCRELANELFCDCYQGSPSIREKVIGSILDMIASER